MLYSSCVLLFVEKLRVLPCQWNYRPDHCMYGSVCKTAETEGVFIVHGNRGYYHNDKQPAFKAIYQSIRDVSTERYYMCVFLCIHVP